jgi:hypothetical protein
MDLRTRHSASSAAGNDAKIKQAQRDLERCLLELEGLVRPEVYGKSEADVSDNSASTSRIEKLTEMIRYNMKDLEALTPTERDPVKRDLLRKRLESSTQRLIELEKHAQSRGAQWALRARVVREREMLLSKKNDDFDAEAANELRMAVAEQESLKQSSRGVDEMMGIGRAVLESLGSQGETLRRATDKVEGVATSLGLSNSLLRAVRRRQFGDAMIVYGGMIGVTLVLYLFYRWVHS